MRLRVMRSFSLIFLDDFFFFLLSPAAATARLAVGGGRNKKKKIKITIYARDRVDKSIEAVCVLRRAPRCATGERRNKFQRFPNNELDRESKKESNGAGELWPARG